MSELEDYKNALESIASGDTLYIGLTVEEFAAKTLAKYKPKPLEGLPVDTLLEEGREWEWLYPG